MIEPVTIGRATLYLGDCREILPTLGNHDARVGRARDEANRRQLGYEALTLADVQHLAQSFHTLCPGWVVWMTNFDLAKPVQQALGDLGRTTFPALPYFHSGRSVRLAGDGPCSWTDWIVVARTKALNKWGTLPGGYIASEGWNDKERMGGKPTRLMQLMVSHYSRPDELVCDPFMGAGTTGVACMKDGRRFVGIEIDREAFELSCKRIEDAQRQGSLFGSEAA